jgi:hypothetical protein
MDGPYTVRVDESIRRWIRLDQPGAGICLLIEGKEYPIDLSDQGDRGQLTSRERTYELDGSGGRLQAKLLINRTPNEVGRREVRVSLKSPRPAPRVAG